MEQLAAFVLGLAGGKAWVAIAVPVLCLLVSEALPMIVKIPANGILHGVYLGVVSLLQAMKAKLMPPPSL